MSSEHIEKNEKNPEEQANISEFTGKVPAALKAGLYIVATPIGNLRDISLRALDVLRAADTIICEDTRVTRKLLHAYNIKGRLQSYNDHSDETRRDAILSLLEEGRVVALVSDAGMPLISDPGYKLVRECADRDLYMTTLPGASAPLAALQLSAFPSDRFSFLGFLPNKSGARQKLLQHWAEVETTLLAFESAPRLIAALKDIEAVLGNREVAVVREITKLYEESRRDMVGALVLHYEEHGLPKGEIVLVISPPEEKEFGDDELTDMIRDALETMKNKDAAKHVAEKTGVKKTILYDIALAVSKEEA